jgi:hypothetical protein
MFDHLEYKNRQVYGSSTPPEYNLNLVKIPVAIYAGDVDAIVDYKVGLLRNISGFFKAQAEKLKKA